MISYKLLEREVRYKTSRNSGPGGQHVNKVETKVQLLFDIKASVVLTESQKELLYHKLPGRINRSGVLRVTSSKGRTQYANKQLALARFFDLVSNAVKEVKPRRKRKPGIASVEKRLKQKKAISEKKQRRQYLSDE